MLRISVVIPLILYGKACEENGIDIENVDNYKELINEAEKVYKISIFENGMMSIVFKYNITFLISKTAVDKETYYDHFLFQLKKDKLGLENDEFYHLYARQTSKIEKGMNNKGICIFFCEKLEINMEKQIDNFDEVKEAVFLYSKMLTKIAYTYLKSIHDAEDVVQDVFLIYITKNAEFENEEHRRNWLVRCTINKCKDLLKASWYKNWLPISEDLEYQEPEGSEIIQMVLKLETKYRIPIYLHYCEGYSLKEIAALLNKKVSTVGTLLARGRKKLEAMIEKEQSYRKGDQL